MKYQCTSCNKTFTHPAKTITPKDEQDKGTTIAIPGYIFQVPTIEAYVCPFCKSLEFNEYVEPQEDITSVKSVPLEECDAWIVKGYKVRELYAKSATLVLMEAKKA